MLVIMKQTALFISFQWVLNGRKRFQFLIAKISLQKHCSSLFYLHQLYEYMRMPFHTENIFNW